MNKPSNKVAPTAKSLWQHHKVKVISLLLLIILFTAIEKNSIILQSLSTEIHHSKQPEAPISDKNEPVLSTNKKEIPAPTRQETKKNDLKQKVIIKRPSLFTVQLMGSQYLQRLLNWSKIHQLGQGSWVVRKTRHGKDWFVLNYGRFGTMNEARDVLANLPKTIKEAKPWIHPIDQ